MRFAQETDSSRTRPFLLISTAFMIFAVLIFGRLFLFFLLVRSHSFDDTVLAEATGNRWLDWNVWLACRHLFFWRTDGLITTVPVFDSVGTVLLLCLGLCLLVVVTNRRMEVPRPARPRILDAGLFWGMTSIIGAITLVLLVAAVVPVVPVDEYHAAYRQVLSEPEGRYDYSSHYGAFLEKYDLALPEDVRDDLSAEDLEQVELGRRFHRYREAERWEFHY